MKKCFNIANNQIVVIEDNKKMFFSYGSYIASYEYNDIDNTYTLTLTSLYDYSRTTSKWLKVFLQDYCNFYYDNTNELRKMIQKGGCDNVTIQVIS